MIFLFVTVMMKLNRNSKSNNLKISFHLSDTADMRFIRTRHVWGLVWTKTLRPLERDPVVATGQCVKVHVDDFNRSLLQGPEESSREFP